MTNLRLIAAVATVSIVALSDLEMVHASRAQHNNKNKKEDTKREATATDNAKRNNNARKAALAASSVLKDGASPVVPGAAKLKPIDSNNAEEEEKLEKIGEDIALLKLDDKVYWNRFLQNSGSAGATPSAAPSKRPTLVPPTPVPPVPTNPVPTNPVPTNPVPTNPVPTNPVQPTITSSFSFVRRTRRQRRVKKRNDSDA